MSGAGESVDELGDQLLQPLAEDCAMEVSDKVDGFESSSHPLSYELRLSTLKKRLVVQGYTGSRGGSYRELTSRVKEDMGRRGARAAWFIPVFLTAITNDLRTNEVGAFDSNRGRSL